MFSKSYFASLLMVATFMQYLDVAESRSKGCIGSVVTKATTYLQSFDGGEAEGTVVFEQAFPAMPVTVRGNITGLSPGMHGFHIHQLGNIVGGCKSAAGHFNPFGLTHGSPKQNSRHVGDLGNIKANDDGIASFEIIDAYISLNGPATILSRAVVVHAKIDDLGKGDDAESLRTGNAGSRVACGVVGITEEKQIYKCRK